MATLAKKMESCGVEPNWLDLPRELIESIMKKLLLVDKVRLKAVCKSWNKAATSYLWSHREKSPWLILPQEKVEEEEKDDDNDNKCNIFQGEDDRFYYSCFINFADQEQKRYKVNMYKGLGDDYYGPRCVGSSYGWLIIFDQTSLGCLFNPFTGTKIQLPIKADDTLVGKAILLSDPSSSSTKSFTLVIYYGFFHHLAFCIHKGNGEYKYIIKDKAWTRFGGAFYSDIMCHNNKLYALRFSECSKIKLENNGQVEVWDFDDCFPKKVATFKPPLPLPHGFLPPSLDFFPVSRCKFYSHMHLVESLGDILFVFLESSRSGIGQDIKEFFHVYKLLDHDGKRWEKVENLKGQALFIGENQAISLSAGEFPEWKENSIYVTSYIPHVRVYNLDEKVLRNLIEYFFVPLWIVPCCF
ncbi:putative F-box protein At4g17565 isoform X1 [Ziziphus jujuba]|uniref:F-box protein At4g17565 isoform X1 n=1 Tax=Ziziphus jujuba TaxID=326968 RepID=A0ABM3I5N6_ZIZJJ|nr:putative F-box protein At4g17565 isoform X1 [Ziziphus jujuba]XP_048321091.1 putative F-box protein At4g17565 isoform X1 [Ziziphus jujuba]XP_048321092.1 putative F-box protein At4g17565 isoform X1 [Ziziphus jujuba]XP_048321093.1 putative F-box protein At4g17565 isoform X1 [Ziziphus jujuba]XP_048321094.1 putative F-box protein At4g17565 isoform X1 [Ziziphus jujuba]XP_048321095.1 putative F-box protein At4g17565 isoform X1 [Ziziphus jujuba var. spinosa]